MQFEKTKIILCHGVANLSKGAAGLLSLINEPEREAWYLFSNRSRSLVKCVCRDRFGVWATSRRLNNGRFQWIERAEGSSVIDAKIARELCLGKKPKIYE
ncbi:MAG: transposase [Candidatus Azotimanducaceae bacterium]|jgi:transposase